MVLAHSLLLPNLKLVTERIDAYEQKTSQLQQISSDFAAYGFNRLQTEKLIECRHQVSDILNEYQLIKHKLLNKEIGNMGTPTFGELFVNAERRDITYLETDCNGLLKQIHSPKPNGPENYLSSQIEEAEKIISQADTDHDYDTIIQTYRSLPSKDSDESYLTYNRLSDRYGNALMKNGRFDEAIKIYSDLLAQMKKNELLKKQFSITKRLADLHFSLDQHDKARAIYNEIGGSYADLMKDNEWARLQLGALDVSNQTGELKDYAALLKRYLAYIPKRDGFTLIEEAKKFTESYPFSPVASIADRMMSTTKEEAEKWFSELLNRADTLSKQKQYQDAQLIIERIPPEILTAEKRDQLKAKSNEITVNEAIDAERDRLEKEQDLQEKWNNAILSLEKKNYDKAITIFSSMKDTSYAEKAEKYIIEAVQLAVQDSRRRAAELFIRSTKTSDQENKIKLLLTSRRILQGVLIKYPQTNLADKVNSNIERIEHEITLIDPSLLNSNKLNEEDLINGGNTPSE